MSPCCRGDPKKFKMKLSAKKPPKTTISCPMSISARGRRRRSRDDRSTTIHKLRRVRSIQTITTPLRSGLIGIPSHGHAPPAAAAAVIFFRLESVHNTASGCGGHSPDINTKREKAKNKPMACLRQARKQESCCSFEKNNENQKGKFWGEN